MKTTRPTLAKATLALLVTAGLLGSAKTYAGTDYWINNTATNNLSNASSLWMTTLTGGSAITPVANDVWVFANTTAAALTNNFTSFNLGGITFNSGTAADVIGGNAVTLKGGVTNNSTALQTINFQMNNSGNNTITANSGNITIGGVLQTGTGTLTFNGAATTTLSAGNTFNGGMVVNNNGNLLVLTNYFMNGGSGGSVFNNSGVFSITNSSGQTGGGFRMQGGTNTVNLLSGSTATFNGMNMGAASATNLLFVNSGATMNMTNSMSLGFSGAGNATSAMVNSGVYNQTAGSFIISQAMSGAYSALTNYGSFTYNVTNSAFSLINQSGSNNIARLVQAGGTFLSKGELRFGGGTVSNSTSFVNVTGGVFSNTALVTMGYEGANNANTFQVDGGTAYVTNIQMGSSRSGALSGTNYLNLNGGTFIVGGAISTAGTTETNLISWNGGTLQAGVSSATFFTNSAYTTVTIGSSNAIFNAAGFNDTISQNMGGSGTLIVTNSTGNGTLTLSGSNSFGGVNLSAGSVVAGSSNALGSGTSSIAAGTTLQVTASGVDSRINANGGTLSFSGSGTSSSATLVMGGGTLTIGTGSGGANTMTLGTLTLNGGLLNLSFSVANADRITVTTLNLSNTTTYVNLSGAIAGTYSLLNYSTLNGGTGNLSATNLNSRQAVLFTNNSGASSIQAIVSMTAGVWNGTGSSWSSASSGSWNNYNPAVNGDAALFDTTGASTPNVTVGTGAVAGSITFSNASTGYNIGSVTSSNLALNNGASASTVTVQAGSHTISESTAITNGVAFNESAGTAMTVAGSITGSGGLSQGGSGTLVLSGSNSFIGATTVNGGTLVVSNANALSSGALNVAAGTLTNDAYSLSAGAVTLGNGTISGTGTLTGTSYTANNTGNALVNQTLTGPGSFTQTGTGTTTLSGANLYTGATTVNTGGTLTVTGLLGGGNYTTNLTVNGTLNLSSSGSQTISKNIAGTGGTININGSGVTTLTNQSAYTPLTLVNSGSGTLNLFNNSGTAYIYLNGSNTINNYGTLNAGNFRLTGNATNVLNFFGGTASLGGMTIGAGGGMSTVDLITIYSGATVNSSASVTLGFYGGSNTLVVNSGGTFNANSGIFLGQANNNSYNGLTNYGTITNTGSDIKMNGQSGTNNSAVLVQAAGSFISTNNFSIGGGGASMTPYGLSNSTALLDVKGGLFSNAGSVYLGNGGNNMTNTFTVEGTGTAIVGGNLYLGQTGNLYGTGSSTNNNGTLYSNTSYFTNIAGQTWPVLVVATYTNTNTAQTLSSSVSYVITNNNTVNLLTGGTLVVNGTISSGGVVVGTNATSIVGTNTTGKFTFNWNGGTLQAGTNSTSFFVNSSNTTVTLGASGGRFDSAGFNDTISQNLSGPGGLNVTNSTGIGTLTLSGSNSYQGATVLNSGALVTTYNPSTTYAVSNPNISFFAKAISVMPWATGVLGGISAQMSNATFGVDVSGTNYTVADDMVNANGGINFAVIGSGTLGLASGNFNSGVTNWTVNGATLSVTNLASLNAGTPVTLTGNGVLSLDGNSAVTVGNNVSVNSSFTGSIVNNTGFSAGLTGTLTKNNAILKLLKGSFNVSGNIVGSSPNSDLYVSSGANVTLSGNNSYNGPTHVDTGSTLVLGSATALPSNTDIVLGSAGDSAGQVNKLDLASYSATAASLTVSGSSTSTVTDSVGGASLNLTGDVTVTNTSTLSLGVPVLGVANVNLNGGTLLLNSGSSINPSANLNMKGGTLALGPSSPSFSNLTLTGNSVVNFAGLAAGSTLTFSGIATMNGYTLTIDNYVPGSSHLNFTSLVPNLSDTDLLNIQFFSDNGLTSLGSAGGSFSGTEIVPVPEPSVVLASILIVALMAFAKREQISRLARRIAVR